MEKEPLITTEDGKENKRMEKIQGVEDKLYSRYDRQVCN